MATKYIVDTHALVWHLEGNPALGQKAANILSSPTSELVLPTIALAEAAYIVDKGRTSIPTVTDLLNDVLADARIDIYPLTIDVLNQSIGLTSVPEMHDRLIVATGVFLESLGDDIKILTKDNSIVLSAVLPIIWK